MINYLGLKQNGVSEHRLVTFTLHCFDLVITLEFCTGLTPIQIPRLTPTFRQSSLALFDVYFPLHLNVYKASKCLAL